MDIEEQRTALQRVLWISSDFKEAIVIDIMDKKNMQLPLLRKYEDIIDEIQEGSSRLVEFEPDLRLISPEPTYLNKYKDERDKNWNVIKEIVVQEPDIYISKKRGPLVKETTEKTGVAKKDIYRLLKKYWFYGKSKNGLLRDYFDCGAPGEERIYKEKPGPKSKDGNSFVVTDKDKKTFEKAIKEFHIKKEMDLKSTHRHMCEKYYTTVFYRKNNVLVPVIEPENMPSLRQFKYWYNKEYSFAEKYSRRHGKRKAEMNVRAFQGDSTERAVDVGYLFEIDSTPADIILVSNDRKTIIGTPTLYIVKDVFSRFIAGFHVNVAPPSTIEQMVALENTGTDKVEFCKRYDIDIEESDWPCAHLPKFLAGDRGELKAKMTENLININVDVANAPSYRGDLKPFVEQHFRITNKQIRELFSKAGAKPGKLIERGDKDPSRDATFTIYEFTQFMILQIIAFNKSVLPREYFVTPEMFTDKVGLTPIEVWSWGKGKRLLHEEPRNLLRYNLLPKETATVTRWGIKFKGMHYTSDLGLKDGWFEEQRIDGKKQVTISYDPRNVSSIFIRLKNGNLEQCFLTPKYSEYEGLHLEDVKAIMKYKKKQLNQKGKEELQHQAELQFKGKQIKH
ncbi:Mu transposase C-terminal domain-containing protein [Oceanobacillus kimchii]|uniref:Mu transposase C-terminal domain-containing protein n=1 Tax=Oceanobacillus kimchii TaxID=746691 RepID=UPI00295ED16C|nr:Mu transposase C-terminal domain-containing protein [Oceanobacillus kimchii]